MIRFDDTDYGEIDLMKGLLAGVAGGLLASYLMEQFQVCLERGFGRDASFQNAQREKARPGDGESRERHLGKGHRP